MDAEKLAKIKALADDVRGDPATREVARRVYERYCQTEETVERKIKAFNDRRHHGMKTSSEYDRFMFMDLAQWKRTSNGNLSHVIVHKQVVWRIVLFRHKKTPTWGWLRIDIENDTSEFSGRFANLAQAHENAWMNLMTM